MKNSTKKLIALLCCGAMLTPNAVSANTLDGLSENTAEIYIIDDDGRCFSDDKLGGDSGWDSTGNVTYSIEKGTLLKELKNSTAYREYSHNVALRDAKTNVTGTYTYEPGDSDTPYPQGLYEVFVALPDVNGTHLAGRMGVTVTNGGTASSEVIVGNNKGAAPWNHGEWQSVGVYDFKGQGDTVALTYYYVDNASFTNSQTAYFDAVKLVKYNGVEDKITSVIVDETGKSWVNGSENWSENNGYVDIEGAVAIGNMTGVSVMTKADSLFSRNSGWGVRLFTTAISTKQKIQTRFPLHIIQSSIKENIRFRYGRHVVQETTTQWILVPPMQRSLPLLDRNIA